MIRRPPVCGNGIYRLVVNKLIEIEKLSRYRWSQFVNNHWHRKFNRR